MAKKKAEDKIRVHNKGRREFQIPPSKPDGKIRIIEPGRAIELEESMALKMIALYPRELINYEDLTSKDSKNLKAENKKLASENERLKKKLKELEAKEETPEVKETPGGGENGAS